LSLIENPRNEQSLPQPRLNEVGIPLFPYDSSLPMIYNGITRVLHLNSEHILYF